jgi:hypothetical protein
MAEDGTLRPVVKHMFSDIPHSGVQNKRIAALKMYGKPCRNLLPCGNFNSRVFRLC